MRKVQRNFLDPDMTVAGIMALLVLLLFLRTWARGLTPFWGDLTYLHYPWRVLDSQILTAGRVPLWNPYAYFGMPLLATMQDSLFYPGTLPYFFWGFATATAVFHALHYWLAGMFGYLWLRSLRLRRAPSLGGGILFAFNGVMLSHMPFPNHLALLSLAPAFLIFFRRPQFLALSLAAAFFAGYPTFLAGAAFGAWALNAVFSSNVGVSLKDGGKSWAAAGLAALGLSACLLLPAVELFVHSHRGQGMVLEEMLRFAFSFSDLKQWISPVLVPWRRFNPAVDWWTCAYLGFFAWAALVWGWLGLPRGRRLGAALLIVGILILILGPSDVLSRWLWTAAPPLKLVRYPGNLAYLAIPLACLLTALGLERLVVWSNELRTPYARLLPVAAAGLIAAELLVYAVGSFPTAPRGLFTDAGPLVRDLQASLGLDRYLLSPLALEKDSGSNVSDWKFRLYGLTNMPFRLKAAGNFGDPLSPEPSYLFMDALYGAKSAQEAAALFPWADVKVLLTPGPLPPSPLWRGEGRHLWTVNRFKGLVAPAYVLSDKEGEKIPAVLDRGAKFPAKARSAGFLQKREDFFLVFGSAPAAGYAYVSEPKYPGWRVRLHAPGGSRVVQALPAMGAFEKVPVPAGAWALAFEYDPWTWRAGLLATVLTFLGVGLWCSSCLV